MLSDCIFCNKDKLNPVLAENEQVFAIKDEYPVSEGHTLIITQKHTQNYFQLSPEEKKALWDMADQLKDQLQEQYQPDGFNLGINIGRAAGQTIDHVHLHLIPRYEGDTEDPTGGVRKVIPEKGNYFE